MTDGFLVHNRDIVHPVDDSVVRVMMGRLMVLRRARGYAPLPLPLPPAASGDSGKGTGYFSGGWSYEKYHRRFEWAAHGAEPAYWGFGIGPIF